MKFITMLLTIFGLLASAGAAESTPKPAKAKDGECRLPEERARNTDWFSQAGWGVFVHYLYGCQCASNRIVRMDGEADWNKCVNEFDTEKFADQIKQTGAAYVIFTMLQRKRFIIAPNATYDRLTGYQPGEACSTRDLVEDLYQSLHKRGIILMLYWTGDGPIDDPQAAKGMGYGGGTPVEYVKKWADVAAEYGERYKDKVAGYWVDGCYGHSGYNEEKWTILANGLRAGNPKRIIALNNPSMSHSNSSTLNDDFTTGENNSFGEVPVARWRDGVQWHVLSFLGGDWCSPGLRYGPDWMADYVRKCNQAGGVVSIDVCLFRDGTIEKSHLECLKGMHRRMEEWKNRKPVPAGNLATWKPARLLSLDGSRDLGPSSDKIAMHGVDGKADTGAQAGGEYPWTYEVDLEKLETIGRIAVSFGKTVFPTRFDIAVSVDGKAWTTILEKTDHDGGRIDIPVPAAKARYIRVIGRKPDGPGQKGSQMSITELEVYPSKAEGGI